MSNPKWFKYEWIWEKSMATGGFGVNTAPLKAHENILIFSKKISIFNQQRELGAGYIRPEGRKQNSIVGDRSGGYLTVVDDGRCPRSILKVRNPNHGSIHPTQKPVALFEYLIKTYTNEGDLILDNCAGSGTTAIAAMNTNRNYILIEKELDYFEVIKERIAKHSPKDYSVIPDNPTLEKNGQLALF
jgi:site-specific DNA-methyltransferase (adenine-specific)